MCETSGQKNQPVAGTKATREQLERKGIELGKKRSQEIKAATGTGQQSWSEYEKRRTA